MAETFNLTPTRIKALEYLADKPDGVYVSGLADAVLTSEYRRKSNYGFSAQQATRSGAGCAVPLIKAGLVRKRDTEYGWGIVSLTDAGRAALASNKAANDPANLSLDAVLAKCTSVES